MKMELLVAIPETAGLRPKQTVELRGTSSALKEIDRRKNLKQIDWLISEIHRIASEQLLELSSSWRMTPHDAFTLHLLDIDGVCVSAGWIAGAA